ncbi:dNA (Cytosine-5-)-methyltransferase [Clostridium sp. CAG:288]|nr:dNA (Cytosine-5-)-methyltransferase [Clostridium sp. CAG:288]
MDKKKSYEDLEKRIIELESKLKFLNKYGLVWDKEDTKEDVVLHCENNIPLLVQEEDKKIICNEGENNILIEGDNYHALTALNFVAKETIDIIYIDPPYNTGHNDFSYNDKFVDKEDCYRHSKWLNMISKRLVLAKELLKKDGIIFISIDDKEQANLKLLCDSIFGENNFITNFCWEKTQHFGRQKINYYSNCEYILCYAKKLFNSDNGSLKELLVEKVKTDLIDAPLFNASNKENILTFKKGTVKFNLKDGTYKTSKNESYLLIKPVIIKNSLNANDLILKFKSRWSQKTIDEEINKGTTFWIKSDGFAIRTVYHLGKTTNESPKQLIFTNTNNPLCSINRFKTKVGVNEEGSNELSNIITQNIFSYPKPVSLIKYLLSLYYNYDLKQHNNNFTVLDFFAGSGTTGQAVMELNKEDGGHRKFILCTNNENNICTGVTYPRLKTVISGIRPDATKYSEGLPNNLFYFKTDFVKDENNTEQARYSLVEKVDGLLCIAENIFEEVERNDYSSHYKSKNKHLFIFNDYYSKEKFDEFKQRILKTIGSKIVYIYSSNNDVDPTLINDKDVIIKPIPSKIYEIYKEIVEEIKRGE